MKKAVAYSCLILAVLFCRIDTQAQGGWQWCRNGVNTSASYELSNTATDSKGNQYTSGFNFQGIDMVFGTITVTDSLNLMQLLVTKTDTTGNYLWAAGSVGSDVYPVGICTDTPGNLFLLGIYDSSTITLGSVTLSNPSYLSMYFIAKYSPSGAVLWAKNITGLAGLNFALTIFDGGIAADNAGNVYFSGEFNEPAMTVGTTTLTNAGYGTKDVFVCKFDGLGNPVWAKSFGDTSDDFVYSLTLTATGNSVLAGNCSTVPTTIIGTGSVSYTSPYLAKFDANGNVLWANNIGWGVNIKALATDASQNIYTTGEIQWSLPIGTDSVTCVGAQNIYVAKYNPSGVVQWAHSAGGTASDYVYAIAVDHYGHSWISGGMGGYGFGYAPVGYTMNFSGHTLALAPNSYDPMFVAGYDSAGNYINSFSFSSGGDDWNSITVDNFGAFYVCGDYLNSNIVFGNDSLIGSLPEQLFIARYRYGTSTGGLLSAPVLTSKLQVNLFPNPANDVCTISSATPFPLHSKAALYDVTGKLINTYELTGYRTNISTARLAAGTYEVIINCDENGRVVKKLEVTR